MVSFDSRLIKNEQNPHCPDTDFQALSEALQRDMSEAVRNVHYALNSMIEWHNKGLAVPRLAMWDLEQALHKMDASHLVTTDYGDPLPEVIVGICNYCSCVVEEDNDSFFFSQEILYCSDICYISEADSDTSSSLPCETNEGHCSDYGIECNCSGGAQ